ncbi:MAG: hypothetical protein KA248_01140 [Kiritimatiellae bacterium]|nr:hypothetical protein [Kiritimatiellia bacterium]
MSAEASTELIYTTNVEGERPSESDNRREDYYIVPALSLSGEAPFGRGTVLTLDTSFGMEKHLIRTDLDSDTAPFGRFRLDSQTALARYTVNLYGAFEREYAEEEGVYVPGDRKTRDITDTTEYGGDVAWTWRGLTLGANYDFTAERHLDPAFEDGDRDETKLGFDASLALREDLSVNYDYERTLTELVNDPEDEAEWEVDESITLDWRLPLWERPEVTYSVGFEREGVVEDPEEESGEWSLIHTLTMDGSWDLSSSLAFSIRASYEYDHDPEEEDISFTYGADVQHEISASAKQSLSVTREPVKTFGSKNDTDSTTVDYLYSKEDLFIYGLGFSAGVNWSRDEPLEEGSVVERTWTYRVSLRHSQALSRRLDRDLSYEYSMEDSNLEDELLVEHRVTLAFSYTF